MQIIKADLSHINSLINLRMDMRCERDNLTPESYEILKNNTEDYLKRCLKAGSYISFIALDNNEIIATVGMTFFEMPPTEKLPVGKVAKVMNMYTKPDYRHKGVGTKLLNHLITNVKDMGYKKIMLNSSPMGKPLYEKHLFKDISNEMELLL